VTIFGRLDRMTSATVDRLHSVAATSEPMLRTPNGRAVADLDRGEILLKGIFDQEPVMTPVEAGNRDRQGNSLQSLVSGTTYQFSVDARRYPDAGNVKQGDRLTLDDTRRFDSVAGEPDGMGRSVLRLVKA